MKWTIRNPEYTGSFRKEIERKAMQPLSAAPLHNDQNRGSSVLLVG